MVANSALNQNPIVLFDGVCNVCNGSVLFAIKRDSQSKLKFASLQSGFGVEQSKNFNLPSSSLNSVLFISKGKLYQKSNAALEIARHLDGLWPALYIFKIVPAFIRDFFYDLIARNRYRWFGKKDECMIPTPELKARFIA
jgi:predicted DCC family thiol-disulfide oxidoreductase YuxK